MIHAVRGARTVCCGVLRGVNANLDGMKEAVASGRRKCQTVFMADDLRDLRINGVEFFRVHGEVSAPARSFGHPLQELVRRFELLRGWRGVWRGNWLLSGGLRI